MADPATQFQQAGLNIPYQYSPVETRLNPPIQLPGTGELWARVGQTAMEASKMLQNTAGINPEVRAQMQYAVDQYHRGQEALAANRKLGPLGNVFVQTTPQGTTMVPPASIQDPTLAATYQQALGLVPKPGGGGGPPPKVNEPSQSTTGDQGEPAKQETPPAKKGPPTPGEMGRPQASVAAPYNMFTGNGGQPPSPDGFQGPSQAQTSAAVQQALQRNQFAATGQGIPAGYQPPQPSGPQGAPAGTFLNPATGSYEPLQTQQPPQPDQATMASWQAQNAHPVMASGDALKWAQNFDTGAQRATYLPHGGPGGEPAYAFHMKGGGVNTVPISQIVKNGGGPAVAGQNTSATLSASDALMNQPQQQAPGMTLGATAQAPPGMELGQGPPAQPPPAPGMTDISGNPLSAYTNVPSQGGPSLADLSAQTAPAGVPARPGEPAPGQPIHPTADTTLTPGDQAAVQAQANQLPAPSGKYTGDSIVSGTTGPYTYYRNDDPNSPSRGRVYTVLPGSAGGYFNQKRWYLGTNQYEEYELPDSAMRKTMWDKWGTNGYLTRGEIGAMSPDEMKPWLQRAWQNENFTRSSPIEGLNSTLDTAEKFHNYLKQISDIEQTLADHGYPRLNSADKLAAATKNAAVSMGVGSMGTMDQQSAAAIRSLDQKVNEAQSLLKEHPGLLGEPGMGGGIETPNINIPGYVHLGLPNIPASDAISDSAWSGQDIKTRSKNLNALQQVSDARYKDLVGQSQTQWLRIDPKHDANMIKIDQGRDFTDPGNQYKDHIYTVSPDEYPEYAKAHPNTPFMTTDGRRMRTPK